MTEDVKWEEDLVFSVGVKMFAATNLEPCDVKLSLKATPAAFAELVERPGIIPAPYLARSESQPLLETADHPFYPLAPRHARFALPASGAKLPLRAADGETPELGRFAIPAGRLPGRSHGGSAPGLSRSDNGSLLCDSPSSVSDSWAALI